MALTVPVRNDVPGRVAAVGRTTLLDTPPEESFDRLTRMAARLLGAPVALISLVTDDRQFFKSATGLPEPWATRREAPLAYSICRHVVETGASLVLDDIRRDPLLRSSPAVRELGWTSYAGVPLVSAEGFVLGALSVVDVVPRLWSERDVGLLHDLAASAVAEIELRTLRGGPASAPPAPAPGDLLCDAAVPMALVTMDGRWQRVNRALADLLGYPPAELVGAPADRVTHPEDRAADAEAIRLLLAGEVASFTTEKRCVTRAGDTVWVLATVTALPAARQLLFVWHEITDL
ncbi:MAG TPA: GAF domain-containing protein, partial [Gemmatimonadales bacterium]|nr:GAF domain-containing protein [Gemmatimonadales bacterium]